MSFGTFNAGENKALPSSLKPRPSLAVVAGDVLISRANVTRLVGAAAFVPSTPKNLMLCDKIFRVVFREDGQIRPRFVAEVFRTQEVRRQIESSLTGTSPTMKNIAKPALLALRFPLPPLDVQDTMIVALDAARAEAARLRAAAAALRVRAAHGFEAAVYGAAVAEAPAEPTAA